MDADRVLHLDGLSAGYDAAAVVRNLDLYVSAGYEFSEWALHILARPIDATHPVPLIEPSALVLEDSPVEASGIPVR